VKGRGYLSQKYKESLFLAKAVAHFKLRGIYDLTQGGKSTWAQDIYSPDTFAPQSEIYQGFWGYLFLNREIMLRDTITRTVIELRNISHYLSPVEIAIFLYGMYFLLKKTGRDRGISIFLFIVIFTFLVTMFFAPDAEERYIQWFLPIIIIGVTIGIAELMKSTKLTNIFLVFIVLIVIIEVSRQTFYTPQIIVNELTQLPAKHTTIAPPDLWLMKHDPGKRVMVRHEGFGFYSRSFIVYTPHVATVADLLQYAHLWYVSYIIALSGEIPNNLSFLISDPKDYPGLKLIKDKNIMIYKVL